jgi:small-conductance mechanosensitive channel
VGILLVATLACTPASGQDTTASAGQLEATRPTAIPQSELADHAEEVAARARRSRELLEPDPEIETILAEWPSFRSSLSDLKIETSKLDDEDTPQPVFDETLRRWSVRYGQLEDWEDALSARIQALNDEIEAVTAIRARWDATRGAAVADSLPETIIGQIDSVLSGTGRLLPRLQTERDRILDLQGRMTYENVEVVETLERLRARQTEALTGRLWYRQEPIWSARRSSSEQRSLFVRSVEVTADYLGDHRGYLWLQILLVIVLGIAFGPLQKRLNLIAEAHGTIPTRIGVFRHPFLPAILIGLLATPLIYPAVPGDLLALTTIVSVPLTILLLIHALLPRARPLILGVGAVVVLFIASRVLFAPEGYDQRIATIVVALTTTLSAGWLIFKSQTRLYMRETAFGRILLNLAGIGMVISLISVVASAVGYAAAADHAFRSVMIGTYSGLYIFVGVQIVNGGVIATLRTRIAHSVIAIRNHDRQISAAAVRLINVASFVYWAFISLDLLGILDPMLKAAGELLNTGWGIGEFEISFIDVVAFALTLWISIKLSQIIRVLLEEDVLGRMQVAKGLATATASLTFYALVALGFAFALSAAGVPLDRLALITGALGIGVGFGLQDIVRNFISGLILMIERPIKVGDTVEFGNQAGTVKKIGIRSSIVRIWEGADVIVPNNNLVSGEVKNWTMDDTSRRIDVTLTVDYETDQELVTRILLEIGNEYEGVAKNPAPSVVFAGFDDRGMTFSLRCWVHDPTGWLGKRNDLSSLAHKRLREAGIKFPALPAVAGP